MRTRFLVAAVLAFAVGAAGGCAGGGGPPPEDTTPPAVSEASLADGAVGVPPDVAILLAFTEPMDTASVEAAFVVTGPSGPVAGAFTWDAAHRSATFRPAAPLSPSADFTAALTPAAHDLAGNPLPAGWLIHFRTAGVPEISDVFPADGQTVSPRFVLAVRIEFTAEMDGDTLGGAFTLVDGAGHAVAGTAAYVLEDGIVPVLSFTFAASLAPRTTYTGTLTTAARSKGGTPLSHPFSFSFTTDAGPQAQLVVGNSPNSHWLNRYGRVTGGLGRIDCGGVATACVAEFDVGTEITLEAQPSQTGVLEGWTGDCYGMTGSTVRLVMDGAKSCTANFGTNPDPLVRPTLTVTYGSWIEQVQSEYAYGGTPAIDCGPAPKDPSVCSATFHPSSSVTLYAYRLATAPVGTLRWICDGDDLGNPGATRQTDGGSTMVWMTRSKTCNVTLIPAPP